MLSLSQVDAIALVNGRHDMETLPLYRPICEEKPQGTGAFSPQWISNAESFWCLPSAIFASIVAGQAKVNFCYSVQRQPVTSS